MPGTVDQVERVRIKKTKWSLSPDPLYGSIPLHPEICNIIRLPVVQRLRGLRQLSTVSIPYPSATHTRYEHSLGTYYLATRAFDALSNRHLTSPDTPRLDLISPCKRLAVQIAAVLHDIGHAPTGHTFELYARRHARTKAYSHEEITADLIRGKGDGKDIKIFLDGLVKESAAKKQADAEVLSPESIASIVLGRPPAFDRSLAYLGQLITGPFDVDKMDYLRRDAFYTGVGTGDCDVWGIIHNMLLHGIEAAGETVWHLRLTTEAAEAVEALHHARNLAYRQIYYQRDHRIAQELVIAALYELSTYRKDLSLEDMSRYTDDQLYDAFSDGTAFTKDVANRIRCGKLYNHLPIEISPDVDFDQSARDQWEDLRRPITTFKYESHMNRLLDLAKNLKMDTNVERIVLDMPRTPITGSETYNEDLFVDAEGETCTLLELCPHLELIYGEMPSPEPEEAPPEVQARLQERFGEDLDQFMAPFLKACAARKAVVAEHGAESALEFGRYLWGATRMAENYEDRISRIRIAVPTQFLATCVQGVWDELRRRRAQVEDDNMGSLGATYKSKLQPIVEFVISEFVIQDEEKSRRLRDRYKAACMSMLKRLMSIWPPQGE
jgi:HD superfamily phosphohydrolase